MQKAAPHFPVRPFGPPAEHERLATATELIPTIRAPEGVTPTPVRINRAALPLHGDIDDHTKRAFRAHAWALGVNERRYEAPPR